MDVLFFWTFASAAMHLPILFLAMVVDVTICGIITPKHHILNIYKTPRILTFSKAGSNYRDSAAEANLIRGSIGRRWGVVTKREVFLLVLPLMSFRYM
jgi:hypothetical protein